MIGLIDGLILLAEIIRSSRPRPAARISLLVLTEWKWGGVKIGAIIELHMWGLHGHYDRDPLPHSPLRTSN